MIASFNLPTLGLLSAILWTVAATIFFSQSGLFRDRLLMFFGSAFLLIGVARFVNIVGVLNDSDLSVWSVLLRSIAAYLLIVGAINGSGLFKKTKYLLALALTVSFYSYVVLGDRPQSVGPLTFSLALGFIFAGFRFLTGEKRTDTTVRSYNLFAVLFLFKALQAGSVVFLGTGEAVTTVLLVLEALTLVGFMAGSVLLSMERHRLAVDCSRELRGDGRGL